VLFKQWNVSTGAQYFGTCAAIVVRTRVGGCPILKLILDFTLFVDLARCSASSANGSRRTGISGTLTRACTRLSQLILYLCFGRAI
jgi:hypothetical protein